MFEVIPQIIEAFPGDVINYRLVMTDFSPMWAALANASINSMRALLPVSTSANFSAYGVHQLQSGIGKIEFTLDAGTIPPAGGFAGGNIQDSDSSVFIAWLINGTAGTLEFITESGTVFSMIYAPTAGDVITLEASGSIWRGYLNGEEKATHAPASGIDYPCFYSASMNAPLPPSATILPPRLIGNWTGYGPADWLTPSHGTLAPASGRAAKFSNTTTPGTYEITARFGSSNDQKATAQVIIQPLQLDMPDVLTVEPGQRIRLATNYDNSQNALVTWTALDGGTVQQNQFTAPVSPGTYRVQASAGTQRVVAAIVVPIVITPGDGEKLVNLNGAPRGRVITLKTNAPSPAWSSSVGGLTPGAPGTALFAVPDIPGDARLTVSSGGETVTVKVPLCEVLSAALEYGYSVEAAKTIISSKTEDEKPYGRVKTPNGRFNNRYELKFNENVAAFKLLLDFWGRHFPEKLFIFEDELMGQLVPCLFDSTVRSEPQGPCEIDYALRVVQA